MTRFLIAAVCVLSLSARADEVAPPSLADFLKAQGFVEIELSESTTKQAEVEVILDDKHPLVMIVDTGATMTLFDRDKLEGLDYELEETNIEFHGVGGKQRLYSTQVKNVAIGGAATGPISVVAGDLGELRKTMRGFGSREIDGLIGHDFLSRYSAVIEVKHSRLYLRIR